MTRPGYCATCDKRLHCRGHDVRIGNEWYHNDGRCLPLHSRCALCGMHCEEASVAQHYFRLEGIRPWGADRELVHAGCVGMACTQIGDYAAPGALECARQMLDERVMPTWIRATARTIEPA